MIGNFTKLRYGHTVCLGYSEYLSGFGRNSSDFETHATDEKLFLIVKNISCSEDPLFYKSFGYQGGKRIYVLYDFKQRQFGWIWDNEMMDRFVILKSKAM